MVHVNRLHILQRFHDYLAEIGHMPEERDAARTLCRSAERRLQDFVKSDALTEKVFKVFRMHEPISVEVPLIELTLRVMPGAS